MAKTLLKIFYSLQVRGTPSENCPLSLIYAYFYLPVKYKYELFHINFRSFHCTGRYELNKLTSLPMCGFIAQLVEHRIGIAEVTGSNPVKP